MNQDLKLLRIDDVSKKTTLAKSTIWLKISQGAFVQPTHIGGICVWKSSDVDAWIESHFQSEKGVVA